ncbi:24141_t:CDS:1, partial [Cetraspora pellucida]
KDEATWSTIEEEVLETLFSSVDQEDPLDDTLVVKEINIKLC